ncbi:MAG: hypothetical protein U9Q72_02160 [Patescibacteria group bacterium]|nr:hypothetical protein [Patescibacteria group bacterium]
MIFFHPFSSVKKIILTIIIISITAWAVSSFYLINHPAKKEKLEEKLEPNYQEFMRLALKYYEDAESALIYKDSEKAKKLLEQSKDYAKQVVSSRDLYQDAKDLLNQIEDKLKKLKKEENPEEENKDKATKKKE